MPIKFGMGKKLKIIQLVILPGERMASNATVIINRNEAIPLSGHQNHQL